MRQNCGVKIIFILLSFIFGGILSLLSASPLIKGVSYEYLNEKDFERISEYFSGKENDGRRTVLRTDPNLRTGGYFEVELGRAVLKEEKDLVIRLFYVKEGDPCEHKVEFDLPKCSVRQRWIMLGLTDLGAIGCDILPLAWSIEVVGRDSGSILGKRDSYVWSQMEDCDTR